MLVSQILFRGHGFGVRFLRPSSYNACVRTQIDLSEGGLKHDVTHTTLQGNICSVQLNILFHMCGRKMQTA